MLKGTFYVIILAMKNEHSPRRLRLVQQETPPHDTSHTPSQPASPQLHSSHSFAERRAAHEQARQFEASINHMAELALQQALGDPSRQEWIQHLRQNTLTQEVDPQDYEAMQMAFSMAMNFALMNDRQAVIDKWSQKHQPEPSSQDHTPASATLEQPADAAPRASVDSGADIIAFPSRAQK